MDFDYVVTIVNAEYYLFRVKNKWCQRRVLLLVKGKLQLLLLLLWVNGIIGSLNIVKAI